MVKNLKDPRLGIVFAVIFIVALLCYKYFFKSQVQPPQDIKVVEIEKIALKDISQTIRLIGTVNAKNSSMLVAQDSGILRVVHDAGAKVKKGEVIAVLENVEVEKNYKLLKNAEEIAETQFKRASSLLKTGSYSKADFELIKNNYILAQKNLADAKIALDKLTFYAAFDGVVGFYKMKSGEQAQAGDKIVKFYDPNFLRVDFDIPSSVIKNINNGQNIRVNGKDYKISTIQKILDDEKHMSPAYVQIECDDCVVGGNVYVDLSIVDKNQVIVVPFEAVFIKQGQTSVYVVKDNSLSLRPIKLGIREKELVEVESGLEVGEEIVSRSTSRLYPGVQVKIHKPE